MIQIDRFKARMKNVTRSTTEYRMSIAEAKGLLEEIEKLEKKLEEKPIAVEAKAVEQDPDPIKRTIDGGTF